MIRQEEIIFFVFIAAVTFVIFAILAVIEFTFLKSTKRLEFPKSLYFAVAANVTGLVVTCIIFAILIVLFFVLFASALGGAGFLAGGSILGIGITILLVPIFIFIGRVLLYKFLKIDKESLSWIYVLISTTASVIFLVVSWVIIAFVTANLGYNF